MKKEDASKLAQKFNDAVADKDLDRFLQFFDNSCEIELMDLKLRGKDGAEKWFKWMFSYCEKAEFDYLNTAFNEDTFFVEYVLKADMKGGDSIKSKQAVVIGFEDKLVKSLRLYFDRLDFAYSVANFPSRLIIDQIVKKSTEGLA